MRGSGNMGTICPRGTYFLGLFVRAFVQEGQFYRDRLSRGTGSVGPEVRGSNQLGTKSVTVPLRSILFQLFQYDIVIVFLPKF